MKRDSMTPEAYRAHIQAKKDKAAAKGKALGLRKPKRRKMSARKAEFKRLKENCKRFTLERGIDRNGGYCEVAMKCQGLEPAVLAYHVFPAKQGNGTKYDVRNLLAACSICNGQEYGARMRGDYDAFHARHKQILGEDLWLELKGLSGRRPMSTVEARELADRIQTMIELGNF